MSMYSWLVIGFFTTGDRVCGHFDEQVKCHGAGPLYSSRNLKSGVGDSLG